MDRRSFLAGAAALAAAAHSAAARADSSADAGAEGEASLLDPAGRPLPQTEEQPSVTTDRFHARVELVARAILEDDPTSAVSAFFPVVAYRMVKAIQDPDRDWKLRLLANFSRDIHDYRRRLGQGSSAAQWAGIDVPMERSRWMKPGSEGNRLGYYRVLRSQLRFAMPGGREQRLEVTSMISWRGEWYVVHLNGFR